MQFGFEVHFYEVKNGILTYISHCNSILTLKKDLLQ
jgi:hypothetical protein